MISKNFKELNRLSTITDYYDVFFVDLWGVVHNGIKLLPNILDVFENLKKKKKECIFSD